ncbi:glycosyltransferase family 4 protein, partial [bacterium]|nr:glycosyltransferase family 4 protein [bacterium]
MRIIIASEIFPPDPGGPATYVTRIVPELLKLGNEVQVVTYADVEESTLENIDGYKVFKIPRQTNILFKYFNYFRQLHHLAKKADLIYAQGLFASGIPAILVKWFLNIKVVVKVVGDVAWERAKNEYDIPELLDDFQDKKYSFNIEVLKYIEHYIAKNVNTIITPSKYLKSIISKWEVPDNSIQVVYNSFESLNTNNLEKEKNNLLYVGRLTNWKGLEAIIEVIPKLKDKYPDILFNIVGDGPLKNNLNNLINKLNLENSVKLVGQVDHDKVGDYYAQASIFLLNSGYEGLPHVLLEALASSVPIIASRMGGNPEVIEDNINGYLVEYNNKEEIFTKIDSLLSDPSKQAEFIEKGKEVLNKFTFNNMVEETNKILKN